MSGGAQARWTAALLAGFAGSGVRHVVASPGSRNAPLLLAAARRNDIDLDVLIDERAAAFFALGIARTTARPVVLLCTSGTAGAHYHAAVIEASHSRVPLIAVTADRPPELHRRGASQTIDQSALFGRHVRSWQHVDPGPGDPSLPSAVRDAQLAVLASLGPEPGPVHLNVALRKPLEPPAEAAASGAPQMPAPASLHPPLPPAASEEAISALRAALEGARRGLIVAGPAALSARHAAADVAELARVTGFPLLADSASQLRRATTSAAPERCDPFDALLGAPAWRRTHRPDLIVQLGNPPLGRGWQAASRDWSGVPRWIVTPWGWPDPLDETTGLVSADPGRTVRGLLAGTPPSVADPEWLRRWRDAGARLERKMSEIARDGAARLTEPAAVRATVAGLGADDLLVLGNSLPVREADAFVAPFPALRGVIHQRGASGIDGLVAGGAGVARSAPALGARSVTLLLGDVSLAHDVGGLDAARLARVPFAVVTLCNGGGRLFDLLPIGSRPDLAGDFERLLRTPPALDVCAAARAFGLPHERAADVSALRAALERARARCGCTVIEALVDGDETARIHGELERAAEELASSRGR